MNRPPVDNDDSLTSREGEPARRTPDFLQLTTSLGQRGCVPWISGRPVTGRGRVPAHTARAAGRGPHGFAAVHSRSSRGMRNDGGRARTAANKVLWLRRWHRREASPRTRSGPPSWHWPPICSPGCRPSRSPRTPRAAGNPNDCACGCSRSPAASRSQGRRRLLHLAARAPSPTWSSKPSTDSTHWQSRLSPQDPSPRPEAGTGTHPSNLRGTVTPWCRPHARATQEPLPEHMITTAKDPG
jgi:hypothetical protein